MPKRRHLDDQTYFQIMEKVAEENNPIWNEDRTREGYPTLSVDEDYLRILNDNAYNYRGFYDKYPESAANADSHWPDEFKTVWHPTFSNQSIYSGKRSQYNPEGAVGGYWIGDDFYAPPNRPRYSFKTGGNVNEPGDNNSGIFGNKTVDTVASFVPILGTLEDAYTFYKNPSWNNAGWLALSLGSDIITGGMASRAIKAARVANNAVGAARAANTAAANEFRAARAANGANHTRQSGARVRQAISSAGSAANTRDAAIRRANDALFDAGIKVGFDQGVNSFLNATQLSLLPQLGARRSLKSGGAIHIDPANRGKFNATKERTGKTTEELTHSKNPLTRKRAIFAQNAAKWNH